MFRVFYSNHFEELSRALAAELSAESDLFAAPTIVVPNRAVASYVKLSMARERGVAANLRLPFLDGFLTEVAEASAPDLGVLDRDRLGVLLRSALCDDELLARPELAPVAAYLGADDDEGGRTLRRLQLAGELSTLYLEYTLSRPAWIEAWPSGPVLGDGPLAATEAWQRALYLAVVGADGSGWRDAAGRPHLPLTAQLETIAPADLIAPARLRLIGFSSLAPAHVRALGRLAEHRHITVYAQNPCGEYWEDVAHDKDETPALERWGRPGRDLTRQLQELCNHDFEERFVDPAAARTTALSLWQSDVLARAPRRDAPHPDVRAGDDSVRVLGCANPRRELEVIAGRIWRHLDADPSLRASDVAVLVPPAELDRYRPHVGAVFAELGDLPFHLVDVPVAAESRLAAALDLLFDLPLGRFTRPELLRLVTHPAVVGRYADVDPGDWIEWAERLGIVHGADASDHAGTYLDGNHFHWDQGIRRLALGAFMTGEKSGARRAVELETRLFVPEELGEDEQRSAARFALLCRSLIADARYAAALQQPLAAWARFFDVAASTYLSPTTAEDERVLERCRQSLAGLADLDLDGAHLSYREARELARTAVGGLRGNRGEYLLRGVTVAPLAPMRPIPYRIVFLAGLGEGRFPAGDRDSALDLRQAGKAIGEVSPRERDRYAFFEAILAAREQLYLSYVARNEETGETLSPSSVVLELRDMLRAGYLCDDDRDALASDAFSERHPLRRFHPSYFKGEPRDAVDALGQRQAQAQALRRDLVAHARASGALLPDRDTMLATLRERPELVPVAARLGVARRPESLAVAPAVHTEREVITLSLARLRSFLEGPLTAWATEIVGMRDDVLEDLVSRCDEPFESDALRRAIFLRGVFLDHLRSGGDLGDLERRVAERADFDELSGRAPVGLFGDRQRAQFLDVLATWRERLAEHGALGAVATHAFGRAREGEDVDALLAPIRIEHGDLRVDLVGTSQPNLGELGSLILIANDKSRPKHLVRGLFDAAVLAAADCGATLGVALLSRGKLELSPMTPWPADDARRYLGELVADFLGGAHDYLMPCEPVIRAMKAARKGKPANLDKLLATVGEGHSDSYGPIDSSRVDPPANPDAIMERRFGPLFAHLEDARG